MHPSIDAAKVLFGRVPNWLQAPFASLEIASGGQVGVVVAGESALQAETGVSGTAKGTAVAANYGSSSRGLLGIGSALSAFCQSAPAPLQPVDYPGTRRGERIGTCLDSPILIF